MTGDASNPPPEPDNDAPTGESQPPFHSATPTSAEPVRDRFRGADRAIINAITHGSPTVVTILAIFTALVLGALTIAFSDSTVLHAWNSFFAAPGGALSATWQSVAAAYSALFEGAIFNPHTVAAAFSGGSVGAIFYPLSQTAAQATPLILTGLAVALAFRAGLFNIGAASQWIGGAIVVTYLGFAVSLPPVIHVIVCLIGGFAGGAVLGWLVGDLKARTGAHEVIVTIMLNYIMYNVLSFVLGTPSALQLRGQANLTSPNIAPDAQLPHVGGPPPQVGVGFLVAIAAAAATWWLIERSTVGFEFRTVGANPSAARTAGMSVPRTWVLAMLLAGGTRQPERRSRHPGHLLQPELPELRDVRLHRHHRRLARACSAARRCARRPALRCAPGRRHGHAGGDVGAGRYHLRHRGTDRPVRRGAAADQGPVPATPDRRRRPGRCREGMERVTALATVVRAPAAPNRRLLAAGALIAFGLVDIVVFGLFSHKGDAAFALSLSGASVTVPTIRVPGSVAYFLGVASILIGIARATVSTSPALRRIGIAAVLLFFVISLLVWSDTGSWTHGIPINIVTLLQATLAGSIPLILGALAGTMGERAGVINIAIEGQLLLGAFTAAIVASTVGVLWLGLIGGSLAGGLVGLVLAAFAIRYLVDQIILGVVLNLLISGITGYLYDRLMVTNAQTYNSASTFSTVKIPGLGDIPIIGPIFFDSTIFLYITYVAIIVVQVGLFSTRWVCASAPSASIRQRRTPSASTSSPSGTGTSSSAACWRGSAAPT